MSVKRVCITCVPASYKQVTFNTWTQKKETDMNMNNNIHFFRFVLFCFTSSFAFTLWVLWMHPIIIFHIGSFFNMDLTHATHALYDMM